MFAFFPGPLQWLAGDLPIDWSIVCLVTFAICIICCAVWFAAKAETERQIEAQKKRKPED